MKKLGVDPTLDPTARLTRSALGRYTEVGSRVTLLEVEMGDYSYVEHDSDIAYSGIGKFCSIASMVRINPGNHPMWRASQNHFTYRAAAYFDDAQDDADFFQWRRDHRVTIGHDVWIGHGAIILPGRTIGTGAVIAAGAVVTKDVAPYTIVAGVPAREVKRRFPEAVGARLMALSWWDWSHDRLRAALEDFRALPVEGFLEKHGG
ncbi:DapH/DapD/GlmU-related protein [Aquabacter sp. CN5-332]|uniref:DapH/DapD/GlmU-related protein n=1 Tax=Aquabacter sp. CN5-332 TaxID=3156608 RepID=UPI0032B3A184